MNSKSIIDVRFCAELQENSAERPSRGSSNPRTASIAEEELTFVSHAMTDRESKATIPQRRERASIPGGTPRHLATITGRCSATPARTTARRACMPAPGSDDTHCPT